MRLPLIVNWDARLNKRGPTVLLSEGTWSFSGTHKSDMVYVITENSKSPIPVDGVLMLVNPGKCFAEFENCRDSSVTIYAEKQ